MPSVYGSGVWLTFKGFLYTPSHQLQICWSVHSTAAEVTENNLNCISQTPDMCQLKNNLTFDTVALNLGNVWSTTTNEAIISVKGLYYISFVLVFAKCHLEATLFVNTMATTSIVKTACKTKENYMMTKERAILLNLKQQDRLSVKIVNGAVATLKRGSVASFAGILVYPK